MAENSSDMVAIFYKRTPGSAWEFVCYSTTSLGGHEFAASLKQQERCILGNKSAEAVVVLREDADAGKIKPLKPPPGWSPSLCPDKEALEYAKKVEETFRAKEVEKAKQEAARKAAEKEAKKKAREKEKAQ